MVAAVVVLPPPPRRTGLGRRSREVARGGCGGELIVGVASMFASWLSSSESPEGAGRRGEAYAAEAGTFDRVPTMTVASSPLANGISVVRMGDK